MIADAKHDEAACSSISDFAANSSGCPLWVVSGLSGNDPLLTFQPPCSLPNEQCGV